MSSYPQFRTFVHIVIHIFVEVPLEAIFNLPAPALVTST